MTTRDLTCGACEYFDVGLVDRATGMSDCLNRSSGRLKIQRLDRACSEFVEDAPFDEAADCTVCA